MASVMSVPDDLKPKLDEVVRRIVSVAHPRMVVLFGSYATGQHTPASDVDLVVVAATATRADLTVALRDAVTPVLAPLTLDLLVYTPEGWERARHLRGFVTREADREGVRLYEAG